MCWLVKPLNLLLEQTNSLILLHSGVNYNWYYILLIIYMLLTTYSGYGQCYAYMYIINSNNGICIIVYQTDYSFTSQRCNLHLDVC